MRKRHLSIAVVALGAAFIALAGTATAAGTGLISGGQIKDGTIGLIDLSKKTKKSLKGQHGPHGLQGAQGPQGQSGADGKQGSQGQQGAQGPKGQQGSQGEQGAQGPQGQQGGEGSQGPQGSPGAPGEAGPEGPKGDKGDKGDSYLADAYYSVAYYDVGDTNAGAIATVACKRLEDTAISGGVSIDDPDNNTPVSQSFPGRMDWTTNKPKPNRLDGWIIQFGGNAGPVSDKDPKKVKVWALCVPSFNVPVERTYTQSDPQ